MTKVLTDVAQGGSPCDSVINIAQLLIHKKFPSMGGFQDVLLGQGLHFNRVRGTFVQVLHTGNPNHWLTVTNAGAPVNTVFVYDSIDQGIPHDAVKQICNMLKLQSPTLTLQAKPSQNQGNTLDCGLFAIANMYSIASGNEPSDLHFNQGALRSHLLKCMERGVIDDFPISLSRTVRVRQKVLTYYLQCVCRQPITDAAADITCAVCSKGYHSMCLDKPVVEEAISRKVFLCSLSCLGEAQTVKV